MTMTTATTSNSRSSTSSSSSSSAAAALQKNPSSSSSSSSIHHIHHHASSTPPSLFSDDKSSSCPPSTTSSSPMMEHTQDRATSLEILPSAILLSILRYSKKKELKTCSWQTLILPISPDTAEAKRGVFYGVIVPTVEFAWSVIIHPIWCHCR
ncbi:hypothetical protein BC829DRAFT_156485 [Chytridium lagenaria]|nr:hypothetical protein BC829DRAFT_156485 [Chytridium lagenaria]